MKMISLIRKNRTISIVLAAQLLILILFALLFCLHKDDQMEVLPVKPEQCREVELGSRRAGDYTIELSYQTSENASAEFTATEDQGRFIHAGIIRLDRLRSFVSYDLRLNGDIKSSLRLNISANTPSALRIDRILFHSNKNGLKRALFLFLLLCAVIDAAMLKRNRVRCHRRALLCLAGIFLFTVLPVFIYGLPAGHDLTDHLRRIDGIATELRYGHFPVRIQSMMREGYGDPVSVFYGDIFLYFPAMLRLMGFNLTEAYKGYLLMISAGTVLISFYAFLQMSGSSARALLMTLAYSTCTYRLVDVYVRAAVGEYTSIMLFPLVALGVSDILEGANGEKLKWKRGVICLSLGMSGIILSHVVSAVMTVFLLLIVCLLMWKKSFSLRALLGFSSAAALTVLESAFFLIPFLEYYLRVPVRMTHPLTPDFPFRQDHGVFPAELFAFFRRPSGWMSLMEDGRMQLTPGIVLIGALIAAFVCLVKKHFTKRMKLYLFCSLLCLFLASFWFPWDYLAAKQFSLFKLFKIQYPYRFLAPAALFLTMLLGTVLKETEKAFPKWVCGIRTGLFALGVFSCLYFTGGLFDQAKIIYTHSAEELNTFDDPCDYMRTESSINASDYTGNPHFVRSYDPDPETSGSVRLLNAAGTDRDYAVTTNDETALELPVFFFKGYQVTDESGNSYPVSDGENGVISIRLPAGFNGTLRLRFVEPWYWRLAEGISLLSLLGIAAFCLIRRRNDACRHIRLQKNAPIERGDNA